jgi:hypothetical protein
MLNQLHTLHNIGGRLRHLFSEDVRSRMKRTIVAGALLFSMVLAACNKRHGPPLSETLSWMAQTYNPYEDGFGGHGSYLSECAANCDDVGAQFSTRETLAYTGCKITHTIVSTRRNDHGLVEAFSLADIDPQSIRMVSNPPLGGAAQVEFSARNNAEALVYGGNIIGKGTRSEFAMDDVAYASRFAEAFRHAVELCGGRPSTFPQTAAVTHEEPLPPRAIVEGPATPSPAPVAESAQELFKLLSPSVFVVEVLDASGSVVATGSGVALGSDEVVTNEHVVKEGKTWRIRHGPETWPASIERLDLDHDLCELKSVGLNAQPVSVRASPSLAVGERVYAIGAPEGLELTLSEGVVSGLRDYGGGRVIQTSAAISPGSSGGGLFDTRGRLIGITTFSMKKGQNLNFALPTEWVEALVRR